MLRKGYLTGEASVDCGKEVSKKYQMHVNIVLTIVAGGVRDGADMI